MLGNYVVYLVYSYWVSYEAAVILLSCFYDKGMEDHVLFIMMCFNVCVPIGATHFLQ